VLFFFIKYCIVFLLMCICVFGFLLGHRWDFEYR
jgi:hypothetical protein